MKLRTFTPIFRLHSIFALSLAAVLMAACAPQAAPPEATPLQPAAPQAPAQALPAAAATSRGDALEATDPATVSLASGRIQLVEFFRFT
jgi:hypothetical protein